MVLHQSSRRVRRLAAISAAVAVLTVSPASASGPTDWVHPNVPGSTTDIASISEMLVSNVGATGAGARHEYCSSSATTPAVVYDPESYTNAAVVSRVTFANTAAHCEERWYMQYYNTRDRAWYNIGSASISGGPGTYLATELRAHCIAGTWLYRVKALDWRSTAKRFTCSDPNDPFRIDS